MMPNFAYVRPKTLEQAVALLAQKGHVALAGGSDLHGCMREGITAPKTVVSLAALPGLAEVAEGPDGGLSLGALCALADLQRHQRLQKGPHAGLAQACAAVGSPQLREQGTLGGNLCQRPRCWYFRSPQPCRRKGGEYCLAMAGDSTYHCILGGDACIIVHPSDTAPMLLALEAVARVAGPSGERRLPLGELFVGPAEDVTRELSLAPGELITHLELPALPPGSRSSYRKVRARQAWDFALASAALCLTLEGRTVTRARLALGGVAPVPWRAREAEKTLEGKALTPALAEAAAKAATAGAAPTEHNAYKVRLTRGAVRAALLDLLG